MIQVAWARYSLATCLLSLPWLISAAAGPVEQIGAWLISAGVLAGLLFFQSLRYWPQSIVIAAGLSFGIAGLQYVGWAAYFSPWLAHAEPGEMLANLRQRNQVASLMLMSLLTLLCLETRPLVSTGRLACSCLLAVLLAIGTALSGSRTGLLQLIALFALCWLWRRSFSGLVWRLIGCAVLAYALAVLVAPWLSALLGHSNAGLLGRVDDANAFSRIALWSNVMELIAQKPFLGHGWRSLAYAHYNNEFSSPRFMELLDNAHNLPLHLAVELGLPIATAFFGFLVWLIWKNRPWAETQADRQLAWGVLLMLGIHSLLEYPLWYGPFFMTTVICVGVLCTDLWRNLLLAATDTARGVIILGVRALGVALLATTAFVAFDYHRVSQIYLQPEQRSSWYAADPLGAAKQSVLFQPQAKFAELQITPLSKETAPRVLALSSELVRWSPEPRIVEKLIESSVMMGLDDVAAFHLKRYRIAYPAAYAQFMGTSRKPTSAL